MICKWCLWNSPLIYGSNQQDRMKWKSEWDTTTSFQHFFELITRINEVVHWCCSFDLVYLILFIWLCYLVLFIGIILRVLHLMLLIYSKFNLNDVMLCLYNSVNNWFIASAISSFFSNVLNLWIISGKCLVMRFDANVIESILCCLFVVE